VRYVLRPMQTEDVDEVVQIERVSFSLSWPASAYRREIRENRIASYVVIQWADDVPQPTVISGAQGESGGLAGTVRRLLRPWIGTNGEEGPRPARILGYAGMWLMVDEAHITTIAVRPELRGRGLGELLLVGMFERAMEVSARWVTLEVRVSNTVAQNLYRKYTFHAEGIRKGYYSDNNEDAVIMWSEDIRTPDFRDKFASLKSALEGRLAQEDSQ
jgi:[ribosomal protein S18]-alanine N-acetyltransferase